VRRKGPTEDQVGQKPLHRRKAGPGMAHSDAGQGVEEREGA